MEKSSYPDPEESSEATPEEIHEATRKVTQGGMPEVIPEQTSKETPGESSRICCEKDYCRCSKWNFWKITVKLKEEIQEEL